MDNLQLQTYSKQYWWVGLVLAGTGIVLHSFINRPQPKVQIIRADQQSATNEIAYVSPALTQITIDIAGAVNQPGVYQLPSESRIVDALEIAGGLHTDADRDWVAQNLNQAQRVTDGLKIYIPLQGESVSTLPVGVLGTNTQSGLVSINQSSQAALEELVGVGPVTAKKIIDNRPYATIDELLTRKVVSSKVYEQNNAKLSL